MIRKGKKPDKELLVTCYLGLRIPRKKLAHELGISIGVLDKAMKEYGIKPMTPGRQRPSLIGHKFGQLVVLEDATGSDRKHPRWKCKCSCGNISLVQGSQLLKGVTKNCRTCGLARGGVSRRTGYGDISGQFWSSIRWAAKTRNIEFELSIQEAWQQFLYQDGICTFTGLSLTFGKGSQGTASLDRVNSKQGYFRDNIQWVHKTVNIMKKDMSDDELIEWCSLISRYRNESLKVQSWL